MARGYDDEPAWEDFSDDWQPGFDWFWNMTLFVPKTWKWYSFIDSHAIELVAAVWAINVFFSLSLVLFGMVNVLLIYGDKSNRYSIIVMLAATSILWLTRLLFQAIYPQGSLYPGLQYGMLSAFMIVSLCYVISQIIILFQSPVFMQVHCG